MILADDLAVIFEDRNTGVVFRLPVLPALDIVDNNLKSAPHQWQQLVEHYLAQMAAMSAVYIQSSHDMRSTVGTNCSMQLVCRKRQRPTTRPVLSPSNAAIAAAASPRDSM